MAIYRLEQDTPEIAETAYVAESAVVVGKVKLEEHASVWFNVSIRGDNELIHIGENSNVQEGAVLHTDIGYPMQIGNNVTIGHLAMVHGCTIGDGSLIGIKAVVLNGAKIGKNCLVGAGALVTEGKEYPDNSLIIGAPAKVARTLTDEDIARMQAGTASYVQRAQLFKTSLKRIA
ncbi:carbonic anhydrase/acetyltransferase-like protein (isoleucine patch superfamily) [Herbaspirillum sp. Sphag1AN]|uniref:gamma carbonic anhydrase family protein n=1 Tax=unclassified Herbaspirillum TaxID=2624150 RepID=UPI001620ED70|nr:MULTISPECIES: gamma carbonic anhydrase family protein [unclassified Herbaspirillum]MBB3212059.1 carbonic anhydrase/acetyltransferase-like protein (isoleucine patch superfamily) [Herbaspirillum sp. Sphag1AN]MBB3244107.1 carbonic anhydrase/acetyltransferase-like protein (isoleucine patch superfamily) [Herbaspirillum sp. Sphag64]